MTFGELKQRICALLTVDTADTSAGSFFSMLSPLLVPTINAVSDKVALGLRCLFREEEVAFSESAFGAKAPLPKNFAMPRGIIAGGKRYGGEVLEVVGEQIYFFAGKAGMYTLCYFSFAEPLTDETADDTVLAFDDFASDTIAYGAAAELCHSIYPSDMTRYMRLATEFDERMTKTVARMGEDRVANTVFGGKRGAF